MLSLYDKAKHLVHDLSLLLQDPKSVTSEEYKRRLEICEICPMRAGNACSLCGCNIALKATKRVWKCGAGHWDGVPLPAPPDPDTYEVDRPTGCVTGRKLKGSDTCCPGWDTCKLRRLTVIDDGKEVELIPICTFEGRKTVPSEQCKGCPNSKAT